MITLGLIIDEYHLEKKVSEFLKCIKKRAKVNIYLEEEYMVNYSDYSFDEDIFFVKAKGDLVINFVKLIERENLPLHLFGEKTDYSMRLRNINDKFKEYAKERSDSELPGEG